MDAYTNFGFGRVFVAPSPATSGTSLTLLGGQGAQMPAPPFNATVWPTTEYPEVSRGEIVRVTAVATDVLTIVRAQEGTTAQTILPGHAIAATITKKTIDDLRDASNLNAGSLADARLSANVARRDQANTFAQTTTFGGAVSAGALTTTGTLTTAAISASGNISTTGTLGATGAITTAGTITEQGRPVGIGQWVDVPWNAALYTAAAGLTFTVPNSAQLAFWYALVGKTCTLSVTLSGFTLSGTASGLDQIYIALPAGVVPSRQAATRGGAGSPLAPVRAGVDPARGNVVYLTHEDGTAWAATVTGTLYFTLTFAFN